MPCEINDIVQFAPEDMPKTEPGITGVIPVLTKQANPSRMEILPVESKKSPAVTIWFAVMLAVLGVLWWQTAHQAVNNYNVLIEGDSTSEGAQVYLDGKLRGQMESAPQSGVKLIGLRCHVADGPHGVEIRKQGFQSFHTQINVSGEEYLTVTLKANP